MTQAEIKNDIAELKATIAVTDNKEELEMLNEGLKELESQLEYSKDEPGGASPKQKKLTRKKIVKAKAKTKSEARSQKPKEKPVEKKPTTVAELKRFLKKGDKLYLSTYKHMTKEGKLVSKIGEERIVNQVRSKDLSFLLENGKESWLEWPKSEEIEFDQKGFSLKQFDLRYDYNKPKTEQKPVSKDDPSGTSPKPTKKTLIIKKEKKEETHQIETSFGKDIKDAILVLNKERFKIREIKDKKTGKTEQQKHSIEYRNAKTIQSRINSIFDSAVYDIARTQKDKKEKKDIIEVVNDIRDLHSLWLNEIDIIIANEEQKDLEKIKTLMLNLMKEARKNDEDNKWRNAGGLAEIAKKFNL